MKKMITLFHSPFYDFESNNYSIGGVETYLRNLFPISRAAGFETHIVFPSKIKKDFFLDDLWFHSIAPTRNLERSLVQNAALIGDPKCDLLLFGDSTLISNNSFATSLAIQHGIYWDREEIHNCKVRGRGISLILRGFQAKRLLDNHSKVSCMVCVDLNYVNWMRALSVANRLSYTYIPNFADTTQAVLRNSCSDKIRIVFARRFEPIRGCRLFANVMKRVLAECPEIELTIAGGGSMEGVLRSFFKNDSRVIFTHYDAAESIAFHSQFDIALVPSIASEGTSLSLLEAMAAGCAVVSTDVGGMSNIILSGHNGILVRPEEEDLYVGVTTLIHNASMRESLSLNARKTVEDSFSRDQWAKRWSRVLENFI